MQNVCMIHKVDTTYANVSTALMVTATRAFLFTDTLHLNYHTHQVIYVLRLFLNYWALLDDRCNERKLFA